eukprot:5148151-Amphidinium_carterae.1
MCTSVALRASIRVSPDVTLIVHHLSGPSKRAHTQTSLERSADCYLDPSAKVESLNSGRATQNPNKRQEAQLAATCRARHYAPQVKITACNLAAM